MVMYYLFNFKAKSTKQTGSARIQLYTINQTFHSFNSKRSWQSLTFTVPADVLLLFPKLFNHPQTPLYNRKVFGGQPKPFLSSLQIQHWSPWEVEWFGHHGTLRSAMHNKKCTEAFKPQESPIGLVRNYSLISQVGQANIWYLFNVMYGIKSNSWKSKQNKEVIIGPHMSHPLPAAADSTQLCGSGWAYMDFPQLTV